MNIYYPFIKYWLAFLNDGTVKKVSIDDVFGNEVPKFLDGLDTKSVQYFYYLDAIGNKLYGIDLVNKIFLINGCLLKLNLPDGEYQLIATLRSQVSSAGSDSLKKFTFGLQATINGENVKKLLVVQPDGSVIEED
jgi:hypothetical protein